MNEEINNNLESRIEISLTSTGKVSYSVKAYGKDAEEIKHKLTELLKVAEEKRLQLGG